MWTCVDLSPLTGNDRNGRCGRTERALAPGTNNVMNILLPPQHRLPSGDSGLRLQELRQLQDATAETEGGAEGEWVLHAAPAAGATPRATDAAEAGTRGRGGWAIGTEEWYTAHWSCQWNSFTDERMQGRVLAESSFLSRNLLISALCKGTNGSLTFEFHSHDVAVVNLKQKCCKHPVLHQDGNKCYNVQPRKIKPDQISPTMHWVPPLQAASHDYSQLFLHAHTSRLEAAERLLR